MKICHTEAIKLVKEYEEQKNRLIREEDTNSMITYTEAANKPEDSYSFAEMRRAIRILDNKIRAIKTALAKANCQVVVDGFNVTIGEALVMLAQLQNERGQADFLADRRQIERKITPNGVVTYTECLYDVKEAAEYSADLRKKISALQISIDRANLTNYIEIEN